MNENKTAITEMREWLEKEYSPFMELHAVSPILNKALALEASQAEKDKGLVEDFKGVLLEAMGFGSLCWEPRPVGVFQSDMAIDYAEKKIAEILSRHEKGAK